MDNPRIVSVEWACLQGQRPRVAGSNARLNEHGALIRLPILRLRTEDDACGFGLCPTSKEHASTLLGRRLNDVFLANEGVATPWLAFDYPLWDLIAQRAGLPVYALATAMVGVAVQSPYRVPCYDTSLYFDDLHLCDDSAAVQLLAAEALEGYTRGQRAFKVKVGRGARHMPLEKGMVRDIAVVRGLREVLGPDVTIMLDANNGYNLNLAKRILAETADCHVFWLEEAFHEDAILYRDLQLWLKQQGLSVLISDGEGHADPFLLEWARQGLVDVIQYDIVDHGFTRWIATGRLLDTWHARSAPHHYGWHYGNYVACHLAGAIQGFVFVEWDEATTPGLNTSAYTITEGRISVPEQPGFGLTLEEDVFQRAVAASGFILSY